MRAVNLLPEKHRPRRPTGGRRGSSYVLLGVLGAVVVGVLLYVVTLNSINEAKTGIAEAKDETQRANAQAQQLGAYGDFAKVKAERVQSVKLLAGSRMDWERLVRELAHVLPAGVWIQSANAADSSASASGGAGTAPTSGAPGSGSSSSSSPPSGGAPAPDGSTPAADGPSLTVVGCAESQRKVATTLVRLREMQGAVDVKLDNSTAPADEKDSGSGSTPAPAGDSGDCGLVDGEKTYSFQAVVSFEPPAPAPSEPGQVPARLGGGQ